MDGAAVDQLDSAIGAGDARVNVAAVQRVAEHFAAPVSLSPTLPPELMAEAAWRLGWVGLL